MKIEIKGTYEVASIKTEQKILDVDLDQYFKDLKEDNILIESEEELKEYIDDHLRWDLDSTIILPEDEANYLDDSEKYEIVNMDEIVEKYSHIIVKGQVVCCNNHDSGYNYCPICGKKLK